MDNSALLGRLPYNLPVSCDEATMEMEPDTGGSWYSNTLLDEWTLGKRPGISPGKKLNAVRCNASSIMSRCAWAEWCYCFCKAKPRNAIEQTR